MSVPSEKMPVYDERVKYILRSLAAGISREDLAKELNHNDYKALDMYMRRRNFTWNRHEQNYEPREARLSQNSLIDEDIHTGKVSIVIQAFKEETDPKMVAHELGFGSHKELAEYMTKKGYEWSVNEANYVRKLGLEQQGNESNDKVILKSNTNHKKAIKNLVDDNELLSIVRKLYEKLDFDENPIVDRVPRYLVKGIGKNKTVPISHLLHQLIESFSVENHITHREIFEVALIDFFRKYGYKHEVETLFKSE